MTPDERYYAVRVGSKARLTGTATFLVFAIVSCIALAGWQYPGAWAWLMFVCVILNTAMLAVVLIRREEIRGELAGLDRDRRRR